MNPANMPPLGPGTLCAPWAWGGRPVKKLAWLGSVQLPGATPYARWISSFDGLWGFLVSHPPAPDAALPGAFASGTWASMRRFSHPLHELLHVEG